MSPDTAQHPQRNSIVPREKLQARETLTRVPETHSDLPGRSQQRNLQGKPWPRHTKECHTAARDRERQQSRHGSHRHQGKQEQIRGWEIKHIPRHLDDREAVGESWNQEHDQAPHVQAGQEARLRPLTDLLRHRLRGGGRRAYRCKNSDRGTNGAGKGALGWGRRAQGSASQSQAGLAVSCGHF